MKNKLGLKTKTVENSERHLLDRRSKASFLVGAEEDYILARSLLLIGVNDAGLYHYQQCMEKYFKSLLIEKGIIFRDTHDLNKLRKLLEPVDVFFNDKDLEMACVEVSHFEVVGRYPQERIRSYGFMIPNIIDFLDEFSFTMRQQIDRNGVLDSIDRLNRDIFGMSSIDKVYLVDLFFLGNSFFKKTK